MRYPLCSRFRILLIALPALAGCSPITWERDYQKGLQKAVQERRRALIEFMSLWNPESREMEDVFAEPEIQRLMEHYVPIKVDTVMNKTLADQYGVQTLPAFFIIRPDLTVAGGAAGKMDLDRFRVFLIKHSFD